jgi:hypothetical protein
MGTYESQAQLKMAAKELIANWQNLKSSWRDENSRQFEKKYIVLLESELRSAQLAMRRMDAMLNQVRHECA